MPEAPRVLELLGPSTGGIRRHVGLLAEVAASRGFEVRTAGPAGVLAGIRDLNHVVSVGMAPGDLLRGRRELAAALDDVDLVHAHGLKAGWLAATLPRPRPPLIVTAHNVVLGGRTTRHAWLMRFFERLLPALADAVVVATEPLKQSLSTGRTKERFHVILPLGPRPRPDRAPAEVRRDLGVEDGVPLVVSVARLHPQKGLETLIDAAALLAPEVGGLAIAVVGEGPLRKSLEDRARRLGVSETVRFAGQSPNAANEIAAADLVVVTSIWEGIPIVALEALQLGKPIVATPVGIIPDVLEDELSARIVPVGDAPALAAALGAALSDPERTATMAQAGAAAAARLHPEVEAGRVVDLYLEILAAPSGTPRAKV